MVKRLLILFFLALFASVFLPELAIVPVKAAPLEVVTADGRTIMFEVELANTPDKQRRGLMFVERMPAQQGMVFPMQPPRIARFWMRNTLLPLDLIFIRPGGLIAQIATRRDVKSDKVTVSRDAVSAVLEINAGEARKLNINVGDIVRMDAVAF